MNVKTSSFIAALACLLSAGIAAPAAAQTELSAGYQFTRVPDLNLPVGFYVDVSGNVAPMFAIVGEVSGAYKSETVTAGTSSVDVTARLHTFMGGVRVASHTDPKLVPFGQVLIGAARFSGGGSATSSGVTVSAGSSETDFALQIGGGVDAMMWGNLGLRLGADYRRIFISGSGENEFRLVAGIVIPFNK